MSNVLVVYKNRTNIVPVSVGFDVSGETFTSQIRLDPDEESLLLATWDVTFETDGTDGNLILTLDAADTSDIEVLRGWMDMKRDSAGSPLPVFERALEVEFRKAVTV